LTVRFHRDAIGAVVLDIEGTTTPIAFVHDVLFPFARRLLREHLQERRRSPEAREVTRRLRGEWADDVAHGQAPPPWSDEPDAELSSVAAYVEWLMDRDRKSPGLKQLQGHIWERGYRSGALIAEVFPDVGPAVERWRGSGIVVAIYSSGSVLAQQLLFGHTTTGDMTALVDRFFDTEVGAKSSPASYQRIAAALQCTTDRLLFVSDARTELDAARQAGCRVLLCVRPGNPAQSPPPELDMIHGFDEIGIG
jgi:enolase-phosphatase E1